MERIYLINIDDVFDYLNKNHLPYDEVMHMDEETCKNLVDNSSDQYSDVYTLTEFESEFNNDTDNVFSSHRFFIRMF